MLNGGSNNFDMNRKYPPLKKRDKIFLIVNTVIGLFFLGVGLWQIFW
jgi:hypothetical protein